MAVICLFTYHLVFYHLDMNHVWQPKALQLQVHIHIVVNYLLLIPQIGSNRHFFTSEINQLLGGILLN